MFWPTFHRHFVMMRALALGDASIDRDRDNAGIRWRQAVHAAAAAAAAAVCLRMQPSQLMEVGRHCSVQGSGHRASGAKSFSTGGPFCSPKFGFAVRSSLGSSRPSPYRPSRRL